MSENDLGAGLFCFAVALACLVFLVVGVRRGITVAIEPLSGLAGPVDRARKPILFWLGQIVNVGILVWMIVVGWPIWMHYLAMYR